MKKSIIALMGLFTLIACSEDVYQDADKMNDTGTVDNSSGGMQTNSVDASLPGSAIPGYVTPFYQSPFYFSGGSTGSVEYHFVNNTPFNIVIKPSVGFYVYGQPSDPYYANYISNPGDYPNLFAGGNQYGNTVELDPIILFAGSTLMHGPSTGGLPINGATWGSGFDYASSSITTPEVMAMMEIGKMHHLQYEIYDRGFDPDGVNHFATGVLRQQVGDDNMTASMFPSNWRYIAGSSFNPELVFIANMGSGTRGELCLVSSDDALTIVPSQVDIVDPSSAAAPTYTLSYTTDPTGIYIVFQ